MKANKELWVTCEYKYIYIDRYPRVTPQSATKIST